MGRVIRQTDGCYLALVELCNEGSIKSSRGVGHLMIVMAFCFNLVSLLFDVTLLR